MEISTRLFTRDLSLYWRLFLRVYRLYYGLFCLRFLYVVEYTIHHGRAISFDIEAFSFAIDRHYTFSIYLGGMESLLRIRQSSRADIYDHGRIRLLLRAFFVDFLEY